MSTTLLTSRQRTLAVLRRDIKAIVLIAAGLAVFGIGSVFSPRVMCAFVECQVESGFAQGPHAVLGLVESIFYLVISVFMVVSFAIGCAILVAVDVREHLLPHVVVVPLALVLTLGAVSIAMVKKDPAALVRFSVACVVVGVALAVLALFPGAGLGGGDVKFGAVVAAVTAWFGWQFLLLAFVFAFVAAGVFAVVAITFGVMTRNTQLAFGPFLVAGAWVAITCASFDEMGAQL